MSPDTNFFNLQTLLDLNKFFRTKVCSPLPVPRKWHWHLLVQCCYGISSVQFIRSVVSDSLRSHGLQYTRPVHHQLPELTQTHVHRVRDATQASHPLSSPSPPTFNLSQHQGLFQRVSSSHQVARVLEFQLLHQSFQWLFRTDFP